MSSRRWPACNNAVCGRNMEETKKVYDILIIGSGPAGLSAAIYAARTGLRFAVLEQAAFSGGQMINTNEIENYPGLIKTDGYQLATAMRQQAEQLGTAFLTAQVTGLSKTENGLWCVECGMSRYLSRTVVIAAGARHKELHVEGEERLLGHGVSYCAVCDGGFFKGRTVAVVGGGNTAAEEALYLSGICKTVYLIHRRDTLRADASLVQRILKTENITPVLNSQIKSIEGDEKVTGVWLNTEIHLDVDGVFVAVGIRPNSEPYTAAVACDEQGFLCADETGVTSAPGVFAAGDIRTKALRQIITAASDGANAVLSAQQYINRKGEL